MPDRKPLLIIGCGGHAAVVCDGVDRSRFHLVGYLDDGKPIGTMVGAEKVLGPLDHLSHVAAQHPDICAVVAIGDNAVRRDAVLKAERLVPTLQWVSIVHPSAILSPSADIGAGSVVMAGVVMNCRSAVGRHALLNTGSIIEHDNFFGDFASTGPRVVTGGMVRLGALSHIGIGASVRHGIRIGANSVVGASAYVDRNIGDNLVCFGIPARPQRHRATGSPYL